jgi:predicted nucleotidyltransferase
MDRHEETGQIEAATEALRTVLGNDLIAVYLHGSAVAGDLHPQSDIDLLAVTARPIEEAQRRRLIAALVKISGRHPALRGRPRCLEVMVFLEAELTTPAYPARAEFIYGEWLRDAFEAGQVPGPLSDPENTLVLAQAGKQARPVFEPHGKVLFPAISPAHVRCAMREALPALVGNLVGDERNVLLTLARMWRTAVEGDFVSKDAAAIWAAARMPAPEAATLGLAADAYRGKAEDDWKHRQTEAGRAADYLAQTVSMRLGRS